ncbi:MAG: hemolysin III family protein [Planctomycetes bacterium]|nr:hemolysin III family protein [Planctomycetota bacterium]
MSQPKTSTAVAVVRPYEELANSLTHGVGALLAIAGLVIMTVCASLYGDAWHVTSAAIFGSSMVLLYLSSTLYHAVQAPRAKSFFRSCDHAAIYLLIAGTYTPFALVSLRGPWGWSLFGVVWGLAVLGIFSQGGFLRRMGALRVVLYLAMGWVVVIAAKPLIANLDPGGLTLLALGGLCYTGGVVFYASKRLPYAHAIWHLFVLAGTILHFFAVLLYVIPTS